MPPLTPAPTVNIAPNNLRQANISLFVSDIPFSFRSEVSTSPVTWQITETEAKAANAMLGIEPRPQPTSLNQWVASQFTGDPTVSLSRVQPIPPGCPSSR
jgi:hypothetical protein